MSPRIPVLLLALVPLVGCRALYVGGPKHRTVETATRTELDLEGLVDRLAAYDVVFLGELHDDDRGHELQLAATRGLLERRGALVVSMEMFESDVQHLLDAYLAGEIGEAELLEGSRPWKNYAEHYRPVVELARAEGLPVVAANVPRSLARRVAYEGLPAVMGEPHMPVQVFLLPGTYRELFDRAMGVEEGEVHENPERLATWFAAQCTKDDAMAESIVRALADLGPDPPPVVHWCGRFHSDFQLGTVARLALRRPDLSIGVVTMIRTPRPTRALTDRERAMADYVWIVRGS